MEPSPSLAAAIKADDAAAVARVLEEHPELKAHINEPNPCGAFGQTALLAAVQRKNREMVDVLLRAGVNINQKSHWWAGGFHALDDAWDTRSMASFLIGRGTTTAMDPSDDCTIWYVGDYLKKGAASYSTKIGAFRMSACQAAGRR